MDIDTFKNYVKDTVNGLTIDILPELQQRGIADLCEGTIIYKLLASKCYNFSPAGSNRSMEDIKAIVDNSNLYIDIKTEDTGKSFSMPNLTSIDRLKKFYESDNNYFIILHVKYHVVNDVAIVSDAECMCIEDISFDCMNFANIGKGQLQLKSKLTPSNKTRMQWMNEFAAHGVSHYSKVITDATKRKDSWAILKEHTDV